MKLLISILLFVSWFSTAQSKKYLLLDAGSKIPIEQANIDFLNGSGTHTDVQGHFSLDKNTSSIRISYIGYQSLDLNTNILSFASILFCLILFELPFFILNFF